MDLTTRDFYIAPPSVDTSDAQSSDADSADQVSLASTARAIEATSAAFKKLRTVGSDHKLTSTSSGPAVKTTETTEQSTPFRNPSVKAGDWRCFAKVHARFILIPHGGIVRGGGGGKGAKIESSLVDTEWLCENGSLWIQDGNILFVLDPATPPQSAPLALTRGKVFTFKRRFGEAPPPPEPSRRRSLGGRTRSLSRSRSGSNSITLQRTRTGGNNEPVTPPPVSPEPKVTRRKSVTKTLAEVLSRSRGKGEAVSAPQTAEEGTNTTVEPIDNILSDWPAFIDGRPLTALTIVTRTNILALRAIPASSHGGSLFSLVKSTSPPMSPQISRSSSGADREHSIELGHHLKNDNAIPARVELDVAGATGHEAVVCFEFPSLFLPDEWQHFADYVRDLRDQSTAVSV